MAFHSEKCLFHSTKVQKRKNPPNILTDFFSNNFDGRLSDTHFLAPAAFAVTQLDDVDARRIVLEVERKALAF